MKVMRVLALVLFAAALTLPMWKPKSVTGQSPEQPTTTTAAAPTAAPTGFDTLTNGLVSQADHDADTDVFEEVDDVVRGLGPIFNAQSCAACHQNPVVGGISQISELRAGHLNTAGNFVPATVTINEAGLGAPVTIANRSLINQRAICPGVVTDVDTHLIVFNHPDQQAQERVPGAEDIRTRRMSTNLLGLGFVESISNTTLLNIPNTQPAGMKGQAILVPVFEAGNALRVGRFGWKDQLPSLLSFASDAYLNEMGITNRLNPVEFTKLCDDVPDPLPNGEDPDGDIDAFARFMRATKAPSRDTRLAATASATAGAALFDSVGCDICHLQSITTAPAGTVINGGAFTVPAALGNKIIHPYSDFLLHNVGTGDGIVQSTLPNSTTLDQSTRLKVRTAPLWGVRTRNELMHDGENYTRNDAILRHAGEATSVINSYRALSTAQKNQLIDFLNSL